MPLAQRLAARIRAEGPLRFDAFQEAALYDPEGGYYERAGRVGRAGDFVTGPSWHPAFGRTIGADRAAARPPRPRGRRGGGGRAARRRGLSASGRGGSATEFRLVGVERSAVRRAKAAEKCPGAAWLPSLEEIPSSSLSGLVVCYELFDALPVRALFFEGERLLERVVTLGPGRRGLRVGRGGLRRTAKSCSRALPSPRAFTFKEIRRSRFAPAPLVSPLPWPRVSLAASSSSSTTAHRRALSTRPRARTGRSRRSSRTASRATS